jgi:electron transfer flavoprotein alpha/beta subunit
MEVQLRVEKQRNIELRETIKSHKKQLNNNQLDDLQMRGKTNP